MKMAVIFDLDGTLLDTLEDLKDATNHVLRQYGCADRSLQEIRSFVGTGAANLIRYALPGSPNDPPLEQVLEDYKVYYAAHSQVKTGPYPGILQALAQIREKYPVAVVSNKPDVATKSLCRQYFGDVFALGERSDCPRKPAPDMVNAAMDALGVDSCIYVGDSEVDVATARNAGVKCLSVLWGFRDRDCLKAAGAEHFCNDASQLLSMLESMM